jgi:flagellar protein FliS
MYANGYSVYKTNSVNYASKEQMLLMLVDGAVNFAKRGKIAIEEKDVVKAHECLIKTQNIFLELMASLDRNAGEWANQIFKVYQFINDKLSEANIKKDVKLVDEVLPLIEDIRDIWHEAYNKSKTIGK